MVPKKKAVKRRHNCTEDCADDGPGLAKVGTITPRIPRRWELHNAWYGRLGTAAYLPADQVQQLFNDMELYPSKSQVYEMLHCAKECSRRNSAAYLTFGEFCVFATELKRCYDEQVPRPVLISKFLDRNGETKKYSERKIAKGLSRYEVFLGGSCNPTTWRQETAIPMLKSWGITYYNPQVSHWGPELIELENQAKSNASLLFFVIDNQTRSVASIIEAAHSAGRNQKLILVVTPYSGPGQQIWGEAISGEEYEDLTTGQMVLQDLVERQGIPVFDNIAIALTCTAKVLRENISIQDLGLKDLAQPVKMAHIQLGDKLIKLREAFDALDSSNSGELSLVDVCMAFRILTNQTLSIEDLRDIVGTQKGRQLAVGLQHLDHQDLVEKDVKNIPLENIFVNFDQFCSVMAEFKHNESESRRVWDMVVSKTASLFQAVISPVTKILDWVLPPRLVRSSRLNSSAVSGHNSVARDVYLGGSCGNTAWREEIAIPLLKKNGLTYINPQASRWSKRLIPIEAAAMDNSRILLFVVTDKTRSVASMAVAAHYIGLSCNVILCMQHLKEDAVVGNQQMSKQAVKDYNRGRMYLSDLANREGIPVFADIEEAVQCVINKCK